MRDLAPHNQQLLDFIKLHQPIGTARLFASFDGAGESESAFSRRLQYLKDQGWLLRTGWSARSVWSVNPEARPLHAGPRSVATSGPGPAFDPGHLVAPARINRMAGTYQPPAAIASRPGSDDHTRLPTLRQGQRVAFVPGYIPL